MDSPRLSITDLAGHESTFPLDDGITWRIGRGKNNTIVLTDDAVSRRHAIIQKTEMGDYYVMDAGSRNGTFLKGRRVSTPVLLHDGDEISIGGHKLMFITPLPPSSVDQRKAWSDSQMTGTRVTFTERLVSVLVVDVCGFTRLTQLIDQELLCGFISRWFSDAAEIFRAHGCWALKYIGDAVMAAWMHQPGQEKHEILAALEAISKFVEISSAERYQLPFPLRFGVGLNTGVASLGNAGSGDQPEYTAFGEAVNTAFRIEAGTRQIGADIAIGHTTAGLLGGPSHLESHFQRRSLEMKGYDQPAIVWAGSFSDLRGWIAGRK